MRLPHSLSLLLLGIPALLTLPAPSPARAQAPGAPAAATASPVSIASAAIVAAPPAVDPLFGPAADPQALDGHRGGSDLVKNDLQLSGVTADNLAHHVTTGANSIAGGSFAGASGLPIVIQNSGANVLIQNATILNLHLQ